MEHLSQDFEDAYLVLLSQLERWASASLALRPGGLDALEYSVVAGDIEECRDILDMLTASNAGNGNPAIWPFIKLIRFVGLPENQVVLLILLQGISQITYFEKRLGAS